MADATATLARDSDIMNRESDPEVNDNKNKNNNHKNDSDDDDECVPLIEVLEEHFCVGETTSAVRDFLYGEQCKHVRLDVAEGQEHPQENYEAYMHYSEIIERVLMSFATEHDLSDDYLVGAVNEASEKYVGVFTCVDYILAATDYVCFLSLLADYRGMQ
eukprot:PhM_4_TR7914/c0_g1_i1/m.102229